jgi:hypothetical protein
VELPADGSAAWARAGKRSARSGSQRRRNNDCIFEAVDFIGSVGIVEMTRRRVELEFVIELRV